MTCYLYLLTPPYDAQGNLIRASNSETETTAQYWRDAFGHRAVKDVDGNKTAFFNIGTTQLEAYDATDATASSTIHEPGIDRPLAEVSSSGTLTFYHQDWLGNVVLLTSAAGAKVESYTYDVWGKASAKDAAGQSVATPLSRLLFTAREYDGESSLYHYRARTYSPTLGRFLQADSIDFGGGDVNLFRYVSNNPTFYRDPLGLNREIMLGGPLLLHMWLRVDVYDECGNVIGKMDLHFAPQEGNDFSSNTPDWTPGAAWPIKDIKSDQFADRVLVDTWNKMENDPNAPSWNLAGNCFVATFAGAGAGIR